MTDHRKHIHMLPAHCQDGMLGYIEHGRMVGSFLTSLLENDLRGTFENADDINRAAVFTYLQFLYSHAPSQCWGSPAKVSAWIDQGGLSGVGQ